MTRVPSGSYRKMSDVFKPPRMTCEPTGPPLKLNVNLPTEVSPVLRGAVAAYRKSAALLKRIYPPADPEPGSPWLEIAAVLADAAEKIEALRLRKDD